MVHAGCVFVAGIHLSRTRTSGSNESGRWNAYVHRLDLGLYSPPKEFLGKGVRTHVNSKGKIPSTGKHSLQRGMEPTMLHQAGQQAQHTTNELFQPMTFIQGSTKLSDPWQGSPDRVKSWYSSDYLARHQVL